MEAGACVGRAVDMRTVLLLSLYLLAPEPSESDLLRDSVHVTSAAARPHNELWCFNCRTEVPFSRCAAIHKNDTALGFKCHNDRRICMVKRYSFSTSTENTTTAVKMWALERNCTKHCEPGCIIIGERTKLYACTSCCTDDLCNYDSASDLPTPGRYYLIHYWISLVILLIL